MRSSHVIGPKIEILHTANRGDSYSGRSADLRIRQVGHPLAPERGERNGDALAAVLTQSTSLGATSLPANLGEHK